MTVDYKKKYGKQLQAIKENYRTFDIPYNGKTNKGKDIRENVISSSVTGAVAGNLKIKGSYNGSKATISKLTKKMTANPITGRMAGVLTKRERKALKSAKSVYKSNLFYEIFSNDVVIFSYNLVLNRKCNGKKKN